MLPILLALQAATTLPIAAPPAAGLPPAIVVRGVRLETLRDDLDRCIARGCPPREDIIASVRYAEGLFRTGSYVASKQLLVRAVNRNKGAAAADPLAVSELYLATVNVAVHEGDQALARSSAEARARVLRNAYAADDAAVLFADLSVADMVLRTTPDWREAATLYAGLATRAGGHPKVAAAVALRQATLAGRYGDPNQVRRLLAPVLATSGGEMSGYRIAARALQARVARSRGDGAATDELLAALAREPRAAMPTLVYSPPLPTPGDTAGLGLFQAVDPTTRGADLARTGWVDIGYLIRPDGTVEEPEVLRGDPASGWPTTVLRAVGERRYAPFGEANGAGLYRVARFTLTADYGTPMGSLVRRRLRNPRIEEMILGNDAPKLAARD